MSFAVILSLVLGGHALSLISDERFTSLAACEAAEPVVVQHVLTQISVVDGATVKIVSKYCGLASGLDATPA